MISGDDVLFIAFHSVSIDAFATLWQIIRQRPVQFVFLSVFPNDYCDVALHFVDVINVAVYTSLFLTKHI